MKLNSIIPKNIFYGFRRHNAKQSLVFISTAMKFISIMNKILHKFQPKIFILIKFTKNLLESVCAARRFAHDENYSTKFNKNIVFG